MADKRISQLVERTDIANNDVVPIVASGATTTNKATISSIQTFMQENLDVGVTSVGITLGSSGNDLSVTGSPITTSGNITINIPTASATARGLVSTGTQTFAGAKTFNSDIIVNGVNVGRGGTNVPSNTRVGNSALQDNTTGANNTAVGFGSLIFTTTGTSNTAIGHQVLSNCDGSANTGIGVSSLFNLTTGANNAGFGNGAGNQISSGANNTTSNNSIFIGTDTRPAANNQINQIVIGHQAVGQGSNTVTIGNSSITSNKLFGRVIHADAVNADESATLGQINTSLGGYVTLGTAQTITGQKTFNSTIVGQDSVLTSNGSNPTLLVTHTSGSGIALDISKAGNGEGLRVAKTSGTGNAVTITGGLLSAEAATLTGALNGTSASFTGDLTTSGELLVSGSTGYLQVGTGSISKVSIESTGTIGIIGTRDASDLVLRTNLTPRLTISSTGAATFSSSVTVQGSSLVINGSGSNVAEIKTNSDANALVLVSSGTLADSKPRIEIVGTTNSSAPDQIFYRANTHTFTGSNASLGARVTINNSGNVGIGTASPAEKLDVIGGALAAGNGTIRTGITYSSLGLIGTFTNHDLGVITNGSERMRITSTGNVGIGTASPSRPLDVNGSARANSFASTTGRLAVPSSTFTTFFTPSVSGLYLARVYLSGNNSQFWSAVIMFEFNASTILIVNQTNGINVSTNVSGTNIQVNQIGGSTFDFDFEIIRIG